MAKTIAKKIRGLLDLEEAYFPGYTVSELEYPVELRKGNLLFKGRLDRISVSPEDEPYIVDYKTGAPPTKADSTLREDGSLGDFQIPMYVKLYEETKGIKIGGALFISVNQKDINAVVGKPGTKRGHSREEYQPTLEALESCIEQFAAAAGSLDFVPREIPLETCAACAYKGVCRRIYSLNAEESHGL
jgi:RecB family exonuclease